MLRTLASAKQAKKEQSTTDQSNHSRLRNADGEEH
jgi:hypothetical protein